MRAGRPRLRPPPPGGQAGLAPVRPARHPAVPPQPRPLARARAGPPRHARPAQPDPARPGHPAVRRRSGRASTSRTPSARSSWPPGSGRGRLPHQRHHHRHAHASIVPDAGRRCLRRRGRADFGRHHGRARAPASARTPSSSRTSPPARPPWASPPAFCGPRNKTMSDTHSCETAPPLWRQRLRREGRRPDGPAAPAPLVLGAAGRGCCPTSPWPPCARACTGWAGCDIGPRVALLGRADAGGAGGRRPPPPRRRGQPDRARRHARPGRRDHHRPQRLPQPRRDALHGDPRPGVRLAADERWA